MNTRKNRFSLTAAIVVALLLVIWLLQEVSGPDAAGNNGSARAAESPGNAPGETPEPLPRAAVNPIVAQPFSEARLDVPVEELTTGRRLMVRDRTSGAPVAGAMVHVYDRSLVDHDRVQASLLDRVDFESSIRTRPRRFRADASGVAIIPHGTHGEATLTVTAFTPTRWGVAFFQPDLDQGLEVLVDPDCAVDLAVVHEDGTPAPGIAVTARGERGSVCRHQWMSDERGRVHIASIGPVWPSLGLKPFVFTLAGMTGIDSDPCDPARGAPVDLRIVVPTTAPLRIRVTGLEALPESSRGELRVLVHAEKANQYDWLATRFASGLAITPPLPLGLRMRVRFQSPRQELEDVEVTVDGPTSRDDLRVVDIPLPPVRELLVARLVDVRGQPLCNARIQLTCIGESPFELARRDVATDAEGVLRCTLKRQEPTAPDQYGYRFPYPGGPRLLFMAPGSNDASAVGVEVPLSPTFARGVNDLGTLTLIEPPHIVSGIVLNERREPVPHVLVVGTLMVLAPDGKTMWPEAGEGMLTGADGRFLMRQFTRGTEVEVQCRDGFAQSAPPQTVPVGTVNLEFVRARGGQLAGRVILPEGIPTNAMRVRVIPTRPPPQWTDPEYGASLHPDGRLMSGVLPPGTADVLIQDVQMLAPPVAMVTAVQILAGVITRDPRLDPLDLTKGGNTLTITVKDRAGAPLGDAHVSFPDDRTQEGRPCNAAGVVAFFVPRLPQDLVIKAPGHCDAVLMSVGSSREVVLRPSIVVEIRVASIPPCTFTELGLERTLTWEATLQDQRARFNTPVGSSGGDRLSQCFLFPSAGLWKLSACYPIDNNGQRQRYGVPLEGDGIIRVPDGDGPHTIEIAISAEYLRNFKPKK